MSITLLQPLSLPVQQPEFVLQVGDEPASDEFEDVVPYPEQLGTGYCREIQLQDWLELSIDHYRPHRNHVNSFPEHPHLIQVGFCLSGRLKYRGDLAVAGQCWFCGSGLALGGISEEYAQQVTTIVNVHVSPERFRGSIGGPPGEIPALLSHLLKDGEQVQYLRYGQISWAMQAALQQILNCPYQGITRRLYLESKALELLALSVEQELEVRAGAPSGASLGAPQAVWLKPADLGRIHAAQEILQQRLDNPPSLVELAHLVGLNDCTLKRGFRQVLGTTVFGYLYNRRMERAKQLLQERRLNIAEIAQTVGYANHRSFAVAFRKKFGVSPKQWSVG